MSQIDRTPTVVAPVAFAGVGIVLTLGLAVVGTVAPDNLVRAVLACGVVAALVVMASTTVVHRARADALRAELATIQRPVRSGTDPSAALAESRRELVAWVSDDLRTPLARLQATASALEDGTIEQPIEVAAALAVMSREIEGVAGLVGDLHEMSHGAVRGGGERTPPRPPGPASHAQVERDVPLALVGRPGVAPPGETSTFDVAFRVVPVPEAGPPGARPALGRTVR